MHPRLEYARFVSQFLGLGEIGFGVGFVPFLPVRIAPSIECVPSFRIDLNRRCKVVDRLVVVTLLAVVQATIVVRRGLFRIESDGLIVVSEGFVDLTILNEACAVIEPTVELAPYDSI